MIADARKRREFTTNMKERKEDITVLQLPVKDGYGVRSERLLEGGGDGAVGPSQWIGAPRPHPDPHPASRRERGGQTLCTVGQHRPHSHPGADRTETEPAGGTCSSQKLRGGRVVPAPPQPCMLTQHGPAERAPRSSTATASWSTLAQRGAGDPEVASGRSLHFRV